MFVFLAIFIVFLLYINFLMHKNKRAQENLEKQFWDRERSANFTRKKDISNLNYLIITEDKIPQNLTTDAKKSLETLCGQKMLNLSSMSNTDLKLEYGVANLDELSACDDRFSTFERNAAIYAQELSDAGYTAGICSFLSCRQQQHLHTAGSHLSDRGQSLRNLAAAGSSCAACTVSAKNHSGKT